MKKGGIQKVKILLRDNIYGITVAAMKRLAYIASCDMVGGSMYEIIRETIAEEMLQTLKYILTVTAHAKRTVVSLQDLKYALKLRGLKFYGGDTEYELCKTTKKINKYGGACVVIPKESFKRFRNELSQNFGTFKFSKSFGENFQYFIERRVIQLLYIACQLAAYKGKRKVKASDLKFIKHFKCDTDDTILSP